MAFIETIREEEATDAVRRMYDEEKKSRGYLPNYALIFSHRPHVKEAWNNLLIQVPRAIVFVHM